MTERPPHRMFDVFAALPAAGAILEESSGVVVDANDRFARLVGRDLAASIGHDLDTLIASAGTFDAVVAALDDHEGDEVLVRRACTGDRTVSIAATRHRRDGEPSLLVLTLVDATAPARVERKLAELAQLPEMNPGPVVRLDLDACVLLANPAARAAFGERLQGQSWRDLLREIDPEMWQKILEAHDPVHVDARIGERDYVFAHRRAHDASLVFAFGSDVTAQRRSERLIAEKAAELAEAARFPDMNPGPVLRVDLDGTVLLVNSAARDVFGGELIGADWRTLAGDIDDPTWRSILDARQPIPLEQRVGERDFLFTHRRDHAGRLVFVFGSDITAQRTAERALRRSEKLATLGTLAAGVAHELNNPASATRRAAEQLRAAIEQYERARASFSVSALSLDARSLLEHLEQRGRALTDGSSELGALERADQEALVEEWLDRRGVEGAWDLAPALAGQGMAIDDLDGLASVVEADALSGALASLATSFPVHALLQEIGEGANRISEIVAAVKGYSYLGQAPVQSVDVHEGLDNTLVILRAKIPAGVTVVRGYCDDLPTIAGYGTELNQAWTNLIGNAIDAVGDKGIITIRTMPDGGGVRIEIEDDGDGIDEEIRPRIFDPFFTTKPPGRGTGLGLSTVHSIVVEMHRGSVDVESHHGRTVFRVSLPVAFDHEKA